MNHPHALLRSISIMGLLWAAAITSTGAASHAGVHSAPGDQAQPRGAPLADDLTDGEVRKIDMAQSKITLRHAEIKHLDMPPMTMVFVVKDKTQLTPLKSGDKVRFKATQEAGQFIVTDIQPVQ